MNILNSVFSRRFPSQNGRFRQRKFARRCLVSPLTVVIALGGIFSVFAFFFLRSGNG
jgi:hypothetical protein